MRVKELPHDYILVDINDLIDFYKSGKITKKAYIALFTTHKNDTFYFNESGFYIYIDSEHIEYIGHYTELSAYLENIIW